LTQVRAATLPKTLAANPVLSTWLEFRSDGTVEVRIGKSELGQGIATAVADIAAVELDVDVSQVRMVAPTTHGPDEQRTSGSMSIVESGMSVRVACANARAIFTAAAARIWSVDAKDITVERGVLLHGPTGRQISYAALAADVDLDVPADPNMHPKRPDDVSVQHSGGRIDLPDKVWGKSSFIQDIRPPGMLHGRVVRPPSPGARLASLPAVDLPADVRLVRDGSFLGVVAGTERAAVRAAEVVFGAATWSERATLPDEDSLASYLRSAPCEVVVVAESGRRPARNAVRRTYSRPFLAHASMAPSCGLAQWQGGRLEVWSHTQGVYPLRSAIALALDLEADRITVNHVESAGCYGHNGSDDAAFDAVLLARAVPGRLVRVLWSRADELSWSPFGSAMLADVAATVDDTGDVSSWRCDVFSLGHTSRPGYGGGIPGFVAGLHVGTPLRSGPAVDPPPTRGGGTTRNAVPGYAFPAVDVRGHRVLDESLRTSALRSLGAHMNVFAIESFMDELALMHGVDPLGYRLRQLSDSRGRAVLERAAGLAAWGDAPLPEGRGRGLGYARYKGNGAYCAVVAEVDAFDDIAVRRLTIVVDVGRVVNTDGVANQVEGGAVQATSWTLKERVRFDRFRVTSRDWESYPILRFSEVPEVEVSIIDRPDEPSVGAGEVAQGPASAAIANAVAAAVGVRVRNLPITRAAVVMAIERDCGG
jgi:nicotinate dehydrogenase subunit B